MKTRIFVITWLSYAGFYFCRKNFSVLMPLLSRDEGFSSDQLAKALTIYSIFYAVGQLSSGLMSDWLGPRRVVTAGMLLSATATALMGEADSLWELTLLQGINGFAQACGWPGLLKLMANWFQGRTRGMTMSLWGTNMVLGGFFATVFATWAAAGPSGRSGRKHRTAPQPVAGVGRSLADQGDSGDHRHVLYGEAGALCVPVLAATVHDATAGLSGGGGGLHVLDF
jgi:sugar phosphate permease